MDTMRLTTNSFLAAAIMACSFTLLCAAQQETAPMEHLLVPAPSAGIVMQTNAPEPTGAVRLETGPPVALSRGAEEPKLGISGISFRVKLTWEGEPGVEYIVFWTPTLVPAIWEERGRVLGWKFGSDSFFDPDPGGQAGFYTLGKGRAMVFVPGSDGAGVEYDFYMGKYEVTVAEFARFLSDPVRGFRPPYHYEERIAELRGGTFVPMTGWDDHPIQYIS